MSNVEASWAERIRGTEKSLQFFQAFLSLIVTYDMVKHGKDSSWPLRIADIMALQDSSPSGPVN
jgi:hypothetical protein